MFNVFVVKSCLMEFTALKRLITIIYVFNSFYAKYVLVLEEHMIASLFDRWSFN